MTSKANTQHLKLINRLKKIEKYKDSVFCLDITTWNGLKTEKDNTTKIRLWEQEEGFIFEGNTMSELERFINSERKKAGLFQERK